VIELFVASGREKKDHSSFSAREGVGEYLPGGGKKKAMPGKKDKGPRVRKSPQNRFFFGSTGGGLGERKKGWGKGVLL